MIPDPTEATNDLLSQLLTIQASVAGFQPSLPVEAVSASRYQMQWVNGLWFAALSCSLSTALISMLAKQWLQAYTPRTSGSPLHRARQRQSRYMHLESWHVLGVINALPLLLHVALLLFFAGLIVLLWNVDLVLTIATWIVVALAYSFYFASIWLPLLYPNCPYQHPLSDHLRIWFSPAVSMTFNGSIPNNSSSEHVGKKSEKYVHRVYYLAICKSNLLVNPGLSLFHRMTYSTHQRWSGSLRGQRTSI